MAVKLPGLKMPKLSLPKKGNTQKAFQNLIKGDVKSGIGGFKESMPNNIKDGLSQIKGLSGNNAGIDVNKILGKSASGVEDLLSKNSSMDQITKAFSSQKTFDVSEFTKSAGIQMGGDFDFTDILSQ